MAWPRVVTLETLRMLSCADMLEVKLIRAVVITGVKDNRRWSRDMRECSGASISEERMMSC